jgi:hypothetical protein
MLSYAILNLEGTDDYVQWYSKESSFPRGEYHTVCTLIVESMLSLNTSRIHQDTRSFTVFHSLELALEHPIANVYVPTCSSEGFRKPCRPSYRVMVFDIELLQPEGCCVTMNHEEDVSERANYSEVRRTRKTCQLKEPPIVKDSHVFPVPIPVLGDTNRRFAGLVFAFSSHRLHDRSRS